MESQCFKIGKLKVIYSHQVSPLSVMGIAVNVGSRDEIFEMQHGIAHLLEHSIFLRDQINCKTEIDDFCNKNCCRFDAYTSREDTVFLMEFMEDDLNKVMQFLFNTVYYPHFACFNLEKEKSIIRAEICRSNDSIECKLLDETYDLLYNGHTLSNRVLGTEYTIDDLHCDHLYEFHKSYYTLDNTVLFYIGRSTYLEITKLIEKIYYSYPETNENRSHRVSPTEQEVERHYCSCISQHSEHLIISNYAPKQTKNDILHFSLVNELLASSLGGGILLNELRDKESLLYNIRMRNHLLSDAAFWDIRFDCPKQNHQQCVDILNNILNNIGKYIIKEDLESCKNSLKFNFLKKEESSKHSLLNNALTYLHDGIIFRYKDITDLINTIHLNNILELAEKWLSR